MLKTLGILAGLGVLWYIYRALKAVGFGKDHSTLHKEATQHKKDEEWDEAIQKLKAARKVAYGSKTTYPVRKHLRLPLYLQQAGRMDEAVKEFKKMLRGDYPSVPDSETMFWIQRGIIYDKMRLAYQREAMHDEAAVSEAYSYLCDAYGTMQGNSHDREERLEYYRSEEAARKVAKKYGKKSSYDTGELAEIIHESVHMLSSNDPQQAQEHMAERIDALE